jgi:hypothetical protein
MRRLVFVSLGSLELVVAALVAGLGWQVPSPAKVSTSFSQADRVTERAGAQVRLLHQQVTGLRRLGVQQAANRLQGQTRNVTRLLRAQAVDFDTIGTMRDALGDVARGLDGLAETLDPEALGQLGHGLGETAAFLEGRVVPAAAEAAAHLEKSTAALRVDAQRLGTLLREAPLDLKAVREVHDSLARFRDGMGHMDRALRLQRLGSLREGFQGMETSLSTGADQVERLASYTYPVVTMHGLRPEVSQRPFWPEGGRIADGMRKAATGATAANRELEDMAAELPRLRASLQESCKVVDRVREALAVALAQQEKVEPVLRDAPAHAARLAEELPRIGEDLARVLRDTKQLTQVASALRQAQKGVDGARARWPEVRTTLRQTGSLLRAARAQLEQALRHREQYETALKQSIALGESFAGMLPLFTDQWESRLDEEEQTLAALDESIDELRQGLPAYEETTIGMLRTGRMLAWLVAVSVALHGCYLLLSAGMGRRYSL